MNGYIDLPVDVQSLDDERNITINKVGIKGLKMPLYFENAGHSQHTVMEMALTVNLLAHQKGTHMSRFIETWQKQSQPFSLNSIYTFLTALRQNLQSYAAHCELAFPFFFERRAPISKARSIADFNCTIIAGLVEDQEYYELILKAPVTSLCPCSKEISKYSAHSQRSELTIHLSFKNREAIGCLDINKLLVEMESVGSSQLYPLLKRPDEKYVTEKAYENPRFVEDLVRELVLLLQKRDDLLKFTVASENYESIHNHQAYAKVEYEF